MPKLQKLSRLKPYEDYQKESAEVHVKWEKKQ